MRGTILRTIRTRLDLTQDTRARRIAITMDTMVRWEHDELAIQKPMEHVIRLLESHNNW